MIAIVGLGNIGGKYKNNRHNVGFMFIDSFPKSSNIVLHKPSTMMNSSGVAVLKLIKNYKLETNNLYIVHDDLDMKLGEYKIQFGKGPKIHNGVNSIEEELGTGEFWRVRIGVDNRDPKNRIEGKAYVLQDFLAQEKEIVDMVLKKAARELLERING